MPSNDPNIGWGPKNGYVFQKQYIEIFVPPELIGPLVTHLSLHPALSFQAANQKGEQHCNVKSDDVNAVTWGVFPGHEVMQPTVVDHSAFLLWKDEAF